MAFPFLTLLLNFKLTKIVKRMTIFVLPRYYCSTLLMAAPHKNHDLKSAFTGNCDIYPSETTPQQEKYVGLDFVHWK